MRRLDKDYEAYKEIEQRRMLAILLSEEDEAEAEEMALVDSIWKDGPAYRRIFEYYVRAKERMNDAVDLIDGLIAFEDADAFVKAMREYGATEFTYSCRSTNAIEEMWNLQQVGATMVGMVEINSRQVVDFNKTDWWEKKPAFLFRV